MEMKVVRKFLPWGVVIAGVSLMSYAVGQQVLRQTANDPQIQMAEDWATKLSSGTGPFAASGEKIDVAASLAPYVVIYNESGKAIAGTGYLDNNLAAIPAGVFSYVRSRGEERVTWQPSPGVRSAIVVTKYNGGFVMAGRSLLEIEKREDNLLRQVMLGAGGLLAITFLAVVLKEA